MRVTFAVNGRTVEVNVLGDETLLSVLRDRLHLTGTKEGCAEGECGACTVLLDDRPIDSCIFPAAAVDGRRVVTIEGLATSDGELSPIQQAFVDGFAVQCGFCTPGFVMTLTALLEIDRARTEEEIQTALVGNLCRCTGYRAIVEAALRVAESGL